MSSSLRPFIPLLNARRSFSTTPPSQASILFALGALSNSRETQHFNKLSRLDRVEHSPPLKLIKTSEIDPFPLLTPPPPAASPVRNVSRTSAAAIWDRRALQAGRAVLSDNARQLSRMSQELGRMKRRAIEAKQSRQVERAAWAQEKQKMRTEQQSAAVLILASVATATGLAMWRFWPQGGEAVRDSGEVGRRIAEKARASIPLPAVGRVGEVASVPLATKAVSVEALPVTGESTPIVPEAAHVAAEPVSSWTRTFKNVFWKVQ